MDMIQRLAALFAVAIGLAVAATSETRIVEHPADVLVTEGDEAILKCRTSGEATRCKWLLNRTDNPYELVDVKEFYPKRDGDCSIRIRQVRPVHVGRWVCSVHVSLLHEKLVSRPAAVAIATLTARATQPGFLERPGNVSVAAGRSAELACRTGSTEVSSCGWALPGDVVISLSPRTLSLLDDLPLSFTGDLSAGDCAIRIDAMAARFVGQWSCFFNIGDSTVWSGPAHLEMVSAEASRGGAQSAVSPAVAAVLAISLAALVAVLAAAVWWRRRRSQLRHDKLLENPLYGIRNLQLAAQRRAKHDNRLNSLTAAQAGTPPPAAKTLQQLGLAQRALPNDYSGKASDSSSVSDKERLYAHVYDTPRKSNLYDVPSSREAYSVPRSSYEIPPTPVKVELSGAGHGQGEGNVYEEVHSLRYKDEDMDGYLVPSEKRKM